MRGRWVEDASRWVCLPPGGLRLIGWVALAGVGVGLVGRITGVGVGLVGR